MSALLRILQLLSLALALCSGAAQAADDDATPVVIAHPSVARVDAALLQRLYTGRAVEVAGVPVTVFNASPGVAVRARFLDQVLKFDEDRYVAYWTVRRHVGKGVPPREMKSVAQMIDAVLSTPGAIGYIAAADLRPGLNVIFRP